MKIRYIDKKEKNIMKFKKHILITMLTIIPMFSNAMSNNEEIKVSAKTLSGCTIKFENINLGTFQGAESFGNTTRKVHLDVICTKGTAYTIKTPTPIAVANPDNPSSTLGYTYTVKHLEDPRDSEFIGYRFLNLPANYANTTTTKWFGNGINTAGGTRSAYVSAIGKGEKEIIEFDMEYYKYKKAMKAGEYGATHQFNLDY